MRNTDLSILARVLDHQPETIDPDGLDAAMPRLAAYARGAPWREDDIALVWTSPAARAAYTRERQAVLHAITDRWAAGGFSQEFTRRAADDGDGETLVIREAGMSLRVMKAPGSGDWIINLALSPSALEQLPQGTTVCVSDSGGLEWLRGEPDRIGGLDAFWEDPGETPVERLRTHRLTMRFL
jgi:hypothetical protein